MIEEAFVSFEVAKLLREKGFHEIVNMYYFENGMMSSFCDMWNDWNGIVRSCVYSAPTQQMAMRWLREEKDLYITIRRNLFTFMHRYSAQADNKIKVVSDYVYDTYEQAVEGAIKYCLENLI